MVNPLAFARAIITPPFDLSSGSTSYGSTMSRVRFICAVSASTRSRLSSAKRGGDGLKRGVGLGAVGAAGLGHVGFPAATLAAQDLGGLAHQIDGREPHDEIRRHADDDAGLAVLGGRDKRNDAGPELFLALVREALQILDVDAGDDPRHQGFEE